MKIAFIGAGNLATHMAIKLYESGCTITQVYSRTMKSAKVLSKKVNASPTDRLNSISDSADYYIFSVKDSALEELINSMPHKHGMWIHTAGSIPLDIFSNAVKRYGVIYPLQTFSKNKSIEWSNIPLFIENYNESDISEINVVSQKLSFKTYPLSTEQRKYVHASGVFACNFVNQMYELANQMIKKADLPFDILLPLIDETAKKVHDLNPIEAQTGPAIRFDMNVMNKHLELICATENKEIYKLISKSIHSSQNK